MPPRLIAALAVALATASLAVAAAPARALPTAMGYDDARHLLARTGFGPTDAEVREFAALTREQGVDRLLASVRTAAVTAPPPWTGDREPLRYPRAETATAEERRAFQQRNVREGVELRAWWMQEMLATPSPLTERMTLFWHNHFVSSQQKVRFARLMYEQNATLRANALGNFGTLLHAASKEPAMLVYLDVAQSRKGQPNENFAREVMELFTLGEGHYSEQDIKEAARAFTGWSLDRDTGTYRFRPMLHDPGAKTVLGRSGSFDGDAVLDIILARPQTSEFITAKLWKEFVSPEPDPREVKRIAQVLRGQDYDLKAALRALLLSDAFWAKDQRGTLVKSPAELVVGTLRQLEISPAPAMPLAVAVAGMGENLFSPPNVKGWPGGEVWINSSTLLARKQFLDRVARGNDGPVLAMIATPPQAEAATAADGEPTPTIAPKSALAPQGAQDEDKARARRFAQTVERGLASMRFDANDWLARRPGATQDAKARAAQVLLLPLPPVGSDVPTGEVDAGSFVRATLLDPAYQLK
jgi:uncharacterized protein (DUF1800 family)